MSLGDGFSDSKRRDGVAAHDGAVASGGSLYARPPLSTMWRRARSMRLRSA